MIYLQLTLQIIKIKQHLKIFVYQKSLKLAFKTFFY